MYKIQTITAGSAVASLDFTVPSGYDDLLLVYSVRGDNSSNYQKMTFNGSAANFTQRELQGDGSSAGSSSRTDGWIRASVNPSTFTSNTFSNAAIYIPNYLSNTAKSFSVDTVVENNATTGFDWIIAGLWNNTAAITSISIGADSNFVAGSTATLFGIRKYNTTATPKATGGIITYANGYWVHTFTASGTFTPTQNLTCEYLVIAGGGGGGTLRGGGGGAGGYRSSVSGESSGGGASAESPLSLTASTNYTVTVGAGGAGSSNQSNTGTAGSNSVFSSITSTGGGGGASNSATTGGTGGSGGGAVSGGTAGSQTANQGYAGGAGAGASSNQAAGGGGGAGAVGVNATSGVAGAGGAGVLSSITGTAITRAGGGGGGAELTTAGAGGSGGGGAGTINSTTAGAGTSFTGSGGGGGGWTGSSAGIGGAGGSGVVIIRYAA